MDNKTFMVLVGVENQFSSPPKNEPCLLLIKDGDIYRWIIGYWTLKPLSYDAYHWSLPHWLDGGCEIIKWYKLPDPRLAKNITSTTALDDFWEEIRNSQDDMK